MMAPVPRVPVVLALVAGLLVGPGALGGARADEATPDTTPPQIDTMPVLCSDPCQREVFEFWGDLAEGDDLARIEVRLDDVVVDERPYDDGTGFTPYGWFQPWGADYLQDVDFAVQVSVPDGEHVVTVTASDRAGNVAEHSYAVQGAQVPDAVRHLRAVVRAHRVQLRFGPGPDNGGLVTSYRVTRDGRHVRTYRTGPFLPMPRITFRHLAPGRHRFAVRAVNSAGVGERAVARVRVHH